ncbi:MAG: MFS transporter [Alphaproteobacteria bacterium]|nr:MFS transporter [Alphaproteobacteria bacterium]
MTETTALQRFWAGLLIYKDRRVLLIALMGIASGLPLLLTLSTLGYWLRTQGLDLTSIGLFAAVGLPYSLKFLWAPVIDKVPLPVLTAQLGQRRSWALFIQVLLMGAIAALGFTDPSVAVLPTAIIATVIGFLSASQDVVIDALRIELLTQDEQGAGAAATQGGYRLGLLISGAGALLLSDYVSWTFVFLFLSGFMMLGMIAILMTKEPEHPAMDRITDMRTFMKVGVVSPFSEFLVRPGAFIILTFVLLYKFGDAIGGTMANPFYVDMGFSGTDIALVSKTAGVIATLVGVFAGGVLVRAIGLLPSLVIGGILQAATNMLYAWVAVSGTDISVLAIAVWGDNFTGGLGSAAFIAYLSALCNREFTATQYALLTAFMAFGRTLLSTPSGWLVEQVGWVEFFILTAFLAVPGLVLIFILSRYKAYRPTKPAA